MPRLLAIRFATAAVLAASTGCPLIDIEVGVDDLCVAVSDVSFEGAGSLPAEILSQQDGPVSIERSIRIDEQMASLGEVLGDLEIDATLELRSATATLVPSEMGPQSFSFLHDIDVIAVSDGADAIQVVDCQGCGLDTGTIDLFATPTDLTRFLGAESMRLDISVTGEPPEEDWAMDMNLCFAASGRYQKDL